MCRPDFRPRRTFPAPRAPNALAREAIATVTVVATDARSQGPSRLFALGFLTLFLELTLIRYLAGNNWNLGYFPNFVLNPVFM